MTDKPPRVFGFMLILGVNFAVWAVAIYAGYLLFG